MGAARTKYLEPLRRWQAPLEHAPADFPTSTVTAPFKISTSRPTSPESFFLQQCIYRIHVKIRILTTPQVLLKILKHSTDPLPAAPTTHVQQDRNPPPQTALSARPDAVGVLLGLDLDGVLEVEDCFALPGGESGLGRECYSFFWSVGMCGCGDVRGLRGRESLRRLYEATDARSNAGQGRGRSWRGRVWSVPYLPL